MRHIVLDTHALLWWLLDPARLSRRAYAAIEDPDTDVFVSAVTALEIGVKRSLGKLRAPDELLDDVVARGFEWLPVQPAHGWAVADLPLHHRDPFDRLLIAQARLEGLGIVTTDRNFTAYGVPVIW